MALKRKRVVLTAEKKLEIIKRRKRGETITLLANEYGVGQQTVRDLVKQQPKLEKFVSMCETTAGPSQRKTMKGAKSEQLENVMVKWFFQQRALGEPMSGPYVLAKAQYFAEKLQINEGITLSTGWLRRFKERHGIRELQIQGEQLSADEVGATIFCDTLSNVIKEKGLVPAQIYNADETGLYWRAMPTRTLASANEKTAPGYKISKDRITVLCCSNATGEDKLKLAVVGKSKSPRALKDIKNLPVDYYNHRSAWMTRDIFEMWFKDKYVPHVKKYMDGKGLPQKALLLLDNAPSIHQVKRCQL